MSDNPWNHYNNPSLHAPRSHLHIWMTRLAGLFNHRKLLRCTITEVGFCFSILLLAEQRCRHKAYQFETMTEGSFLLERRMKVLRQDVENLKKWLVCNLSQIIILTLIFN